MHLGTVRSDGAWFGNSFTFDLIDANGILSQFGTLGRICLQR
jgi:hypothetical protein